MTQNLLVVYTIIVLVPYILICRPSEFFKARPKSNEVDDEKKDTSNGEKRKNTAAN